MMVQLTRTVFGSYIFFPGNSVSKKYVLLCTPTVIAIGEKVRQIRLTKSSQGFFAEVMRTQARTYRQVILTKGI